MRRREIIVTHVLLALAASLGAAISGCASPCREPVAQPLVTWSPMRHHSARFCPADGGAFFGHYGTCWFRWPLEWVPCPLLDHPPELNPLIEPPPPPRLEELAPPADGALPPPTPPDPSGAESPSDVDNGFPPAEIEPPPTDTSRHSLWGDGQDGVVRAHYFGPLAPITAPPSEFERVSAAAFEQHEEPWGPPAIAYPRMTPHWETPVPTGAPQ
jgi:hypothetical protein